MIAIIVIVVVGTLLSWAIQKYGLETVKARARAVPRYVIDKLKAGAARLNINLSNYQLVDFDGRIRLPHYYGFGRRRGGTIGLDNMHFVRYTDPVHKFTFVHPDSWAVARSDHPGASIVVQLTCDSEDEGAYKRFSVAWDDVSWSSTTAESFGKAVASQLPNLVPGSQLLSHGPYTLATGLPLARGGSPPRDAMFPSPASASMQPPTDAYQLVYRISDPLDSSVLQLLNVVFVSTHGGRRRAYTVTFGCDSDGYSEALRLARHMIDSFRFDDGTGEGGPTRGGGAGSPAVDLFGAGPGKAAGGAGGASPGGRSSVSGGEDAHVNVWERGKEGYVAPTVPAAGPAAVAPSAPLAPASAAGRGSSGSVSLLSFHRLPTETPPVPGDVAWAASSLPACGLAYAHPSAWWQIASSGRDEAPLSGAAAGLSMHSIGSPGGPTHASPASSSASLGLVRRWTVVHSCDRREMCYKGLSIVCVDLTPCLELLRPGSAMVAATVTDPTSPQALPVDPQAASLLLQYLLYRYRCEAADNDALTRGEPPSGAALSPSDEGLRPWLDALGQRWPAACKLSAPVIGFSSQSSAPGSDRLSLRRSRAVSTASAVSGVSAGSSGFGLGGGGGGLSELVAAPHQTAVQDVRTVATSRLLKVGGWLRSSGASLGAAGGGSSVGSLSPSPSRGSPHGEASRRYSTYSSASLDAESAIGGGGMPAEGQLIPTTSAVLLGIHEAVVPSAGSATTLSLGSHAPASPAGTVGAPSPSASGPLHRRVFGHVVTFSTSSEAFARYEPLAKHVFQSLEAIVA